MRTKFVCTVVVGTAIMLSACGSTTTDASSGAEGVPTTPVTSEAESAAQGTRLWIKPDLVDCIGEARQKCMQVAEAEDGEYLYFYDAIEGFTFIEGTSYVIDVRIDEVEDPPADGSSLAYTLLQIVDEY